MFFVNAEITASDIVDIVTRKKISQKCWRSKKTAQVEMSFAD